MRVAMRGVCLHFRFVYAWYVWLYSLVGWCCVSKGLLLDPSLVCWSLFLLAWWQRLKRPTLSSNSSRAVDLTVVVKEICEFTYYSPWPPIGLQNNGA